MRGPAIILVSLVAALLAGCGGGTTTVTETATVASTGTGTGASASTTASTATGSTPATGTTSTTSTATVAGPTLHLSSFRSPSANIGCVLLGGVARCDIRQRRWSPPPRPASCSSQVDFGQGLEVDATGAGRFVCAGDTTLDPSARPLAYGATSVSGGFRCTSAVTGVSCVSTHTRHGFSLSVQGYRVF